MDSFVQEKNNLNVKSSATSLTQYRMLKTSGCISADVASGGTWFFFWGGAMIDDWGGKMHWGGQKPKICWKWLIFAISSSKRGREVGKEPPTGGEMPPLLWCHHWMMRVMRPISGNIPSGGPLVFQAGYHPGKRTFKTHPKHIFFRYENRP